MNKYLIQISLLSLLVFQIYTLDQQNDSNCKVKDAQSICQECNDGYFLTSSKLCQRCHPNCATCSGPNNNQCGKCAQDKVQIYQSAICLNECPEGYDQYKYFGVDLCLKCDQILQENTWYYPILQDPVKRNCQYSKQYQAQCQDGYYFEPKTNQCLECQQNCKTCYGPTNQYCMSCPTGNYLLNQQCLQRCPQGYYAQDDLCKSCTEKGGQICDEKGNIIQCLANYYKAGDQCLLSCYNGWFMAPHSQEKICLKCPRNCAECNSENKCNQCNEGYSLNEQGQCQFICKQNERYFNGKCQECYGCEKCEGTTCSSCKEKYFLQEEYQYCTQSCSLNSIGDQSTRKCIKCGIGKYADQSINQCKTCIDDCSECHDNNTCSKCMDGYVLVNQKKQCWKGCEEGKSLWYNSQTQKYDCISCQVRNCKKCQPNNPYICETCLNGYLNQNTGVELNIPASMRNKGGKLLYPGYRRLLQQTQSIDIQCTKGCQPKQSFKYSKNLDKCVAINYKTYCGVDYYRSGDICVEKCPENTTPYIRSFHFFKAKSDTLVSKECSKECISSKFNAKNVNGYNICLNCSQGCIHCNSEGKCTKCAQNYQVSKEGKCLTACEQESCVQCTPEFNFNQNRMYVRTFYVLINYEAKTCAKCKPEYYLADGLCVKKCPEGYYIDNDKICQKCFENCVSCTGPNKEQCQS